MLFLKHAGILNGGTAGLSLFLHYKLDVQFVVIFFLINLPFYYFALRRMGWVFEVNSRIAEGSNALWDVVKTKLYKGVDDGLLK